MLEYPWHAGVWQRLAGQDAFAHAYLFSGPSGIGKRALAERLMAFLLCQRPVGSDACGQCKACLLLAAGTHPDRFLLQPEEADKAIRVDQVRDLVGFVTQTAQLSGRKVVLLEPAEAMNVNASNALLKSLEEPSGNTVFLLVSHRPSQLLPTIRSRCIQQACPLPTPEQARQWLEARLSAEDRALAGDLLEIAAGSPIVALRLHAEGVLAMRAKVVESLKQLLKQQLSPSQVAESWNAYPLLLLFDWFADWIHRILRHQLAGNESATGPADMAKVIEYLAQKAPQARVLDLQDWILAHRQKVLNKANLNRGLLLEALLVRWASLLGPG
ncbi:DNA polymerase III subunit delta' [Stutzerimonas urumqiensis]|uniref:DNA polymerase III subunit delta' n=1 Tax=Stutzerimonas urumqiensis TaxID=638269 RepID=UPI003BAB5C83